MSAKLLALRALAPCLPHALRDVLLHLPRALHALVPHMTRVQHALIHHHVMQPLNGMLLQYFFQKS